MIALFRHLLALVTTPFRPMWRLESEKRRPAAAAEFLALQADGATRSDKL